MERLLKEIDRVVNKMTELHKLEKEEEIENIEDQEFKWGEQRKGLQDWVEEHGAYQDENGEWIV